VLQSSGWSAAEVAEALRAYADTPFAVPVPQPQSTVSARDFFTYALMFGVMLFGAIHLVQLFHSVIDFWFEDARYRSGRDIRWAMSVLVVTLPMFLWLSVRERRRLVEDPALYRSAIRRWMTYLTLLASAAVMLGTAAWVIYAFLNGDFTGQFAAKAAVVGVVSGGIFLFYLRDVQRGDDA